VYPYFYPILKKLEFSRHIFKHSQIVIMKIRELGAELFNADRRTDEYTWRS